MQYLKHFASYVRENKLEDLVSVYLINLYTFNIPLLKNFSHFTSAQYLKIAKDSLLSLLQGLESGHAVEEIRKDMNDWKNNGLPNIPKGALSIKDVTLIYSAQKLSVQHFLPYFTADVSVATNIMNECELFYKQVQEIALDLLEEIKTEEQQKRIESEVKYRELFDGATDLIQFVAADGNILYVNNSWKEVLGYVNEEIEGRPIYDFVVDEEVEHYKRLREELLTGSKTTTEIKTCFKKKNGENITVEGSLSCKYKNGVAEYTRGILRDVSSRLKQEKQIQYYINQLAESEGNLKHIIQNAPDAIVVINSENIIVLWNPKAEEVFGWKEDEVIGKILSDIIIPPAFRVGHNNGLKRYLTTKQPKLLNTTVEVPALHKAGHEFFISLTLSHSIPGGRDTFISFIRDITDQKKNQVELENKRNQLEKSNRELQEYAWLTSHDLKEPLRKILTYSDAVLKKFEGQLPEKAITYLEKINKSGNRMNILIEAVLQYSNVRNDRDLFVVTDLNKVVEEVMDDLEFVISSRKAIINITALPIIEAIPIQMRQLFQNLLSNSIKYSKADQPPVININCRTENEGFTIFVTDNGIGFENIFAEKIFHVFQRLLVDKRFEGTGIGLALCKRIIEAHKGRIHADSKPGIGTTFEIYLPARYN